MIALSRQPQPYMVLFCVLYALRPNGSRPKSLSPEILKANYTPISSPRLRIQPSSYRVSSRPRGRYQVDLYISVHGLVCFTTKSIDSAPDAAGNLRYANATDYSLQLAPGSVCYKLSCFAHRANGGVLEGFLNRRSFLSSAPCILL